MFEGQGWGVGRSESDKAEGAVIESGSGKDKGRGILEAHINY